MKQWPQKWLKEGEAIGEARGVKKGKTKLLVELLEKRFQPLDEEQQEIVFSLQVDVVASAIEYLFQASSLDEVLEYINTLKTGLPI